MASQDIQHTLQSVFGFNSFRAGQEKVVKTVLSNQSSVAIFPTGSGKSLCYQLPALHLPNITLVVSPLIALMNDQLDFLRSHNIPACKIDSSLSPKELSQIHQDLKANKYKMLFISVERFKNERFRDFLQQLKITLLVVDEAHCISEWGHNFRPDYLKLPAFSKHFNIPQVLLLTATATPQVIDDICQKFEVARDNVVTTGFYRENLHLSVVPTNSENINQALYNYLSKVKNESSIVYVTLQKTAEEVAAFLISNGIVAHHYHAGMKTEERDMIQQQFMNNEINCIVATIAFGMGIDKSNIRHVIHANLPKSIESYSQETGRAGRDGLVSNCLVLANLDSVNILENFIYGDTPEQKDIAAVLEEIKNNAPVWEVQLYQLSTISNIRQLTLKTLLVYLELEGIISPSYSYFREYRYKEIISTDEILQKFNGERKQFLKAVFDNSSKARLWTTVDFENIVNAYPSTDRKRIIAALDYLNEQNYITLEAKGQTEQYSVLTDDFSVFELAKKLYLKFKQKETAEIARIHKLIGFISGNRCLQKELSEYFGDHNCPEKCGNCSVCKGETIQLERATLPAISIEEIKESIKLLNEKLPVSPELVTKFLCGITTPVFSKYKLKSVKGFASMENYRFNEVLECVNSLN